MARGSDLSSSSERLPASTLKQPAVPEKRGSIARRIGRNVGIVVTGNAAVAGFGLLTLALNARALGTAGLGVLALILTTATLIDRIAAFQTWQPLVKLGADALAVGDKKRVREIITVGFLFDAIAAMAAAVAAVSIVLFAGERLGIPAEYVGVAAIYMATLVTRIADAPSGLMRLFDRFGLLTTLRAGEAAGQCLAAAILFLLEAPLGGYVLSFAAVAVVTNVAILASALKIADGVGTAPRLRSLGAAWSATWRQYWAFSWTLSIASTLNTLRMRAPVLLIGALLGPAAVGIYHVAERIVGGILMTTSILHQALYPEAARLATDQRPSDLEWFVQRIVAISALVAIVVLFAALAVGHSLVLIVGGEDYGGAYWPLVLLIVSYGFNMTGIALHSVILVTAGPKKVLMSHLVPFLALLPTLPLLTLQFGITGAAGAQIIYDALWLAILALAFRTWMLREKQTHFANHQRIGR